MNTQNRNRPACVVWFKVYAAMMAFCWLVFAVLGLIFTFSAPALADTDWDMAADMFSGLAFLVAGGGLFLVYALALFLKPRPWVWILDLLLILLGMLSCLLMLFLIPLLIFWMKAETKRYFRFT